MPNGSDNPAHNENGDHQSHESATDDGVGDFSVANFAEFSLAIPLANALPVLVVANAVIFAFRGALHLCL